MQIQHPWDETVRDLHYICLVSPPLARCIPNVSKGELPKPNSSPQNHNNLRKDLEKKTALFGGENKHIVDKPSIALENIVKKIIITARAEL